MKFLFFLERAPRVNNLHCTYIVSVYNEVDYVA